MNVFLQELINRLINYLVRISKGDTYEEKLEQLLRKTLVITFFTVLLTATMTSKYLVSSWYLQDLEKAITKIDQFMGTQSNQINQLFKINNDYMARLQNFREATDEMVHDIRSLGQENQDLKAENKELKDKLDKKEKNKK